MVGWPKTVNVPLPLPYSFEFPFLFDGYSFFQSVVSPQVKQPFALDPFPLDLPLLLTWPPYVVIKVTSVILVIAVVLIAVVTVVIGGAEFHRFVVPFLEVDIVFAFERMLFLSLCGLSVQTCVPCHLPQGVTVGCSHK